LPVDSDLMPRGATVAVILLLAAFNLARGIAAVGWGFGPSGLAPVWFALAAGLAFAARLAYQRRSE
jgi:hypothetical protein